MKIAIITGIPGQHGAKLAEVLLDEPYQLHGIKRRAAFFNTERIDQQYQEPAGLTPELRLALVC